MSRPRIRPDGGPLRATRVAPDDTIFALSSGTPPAGIAVVRVSGPAAGAALDRLIGPDAAPRPTPRVASVRTLRDPGGDPLDEALVLWLPGPATATGEDLAELHLHGGQATVRAVLGVLADMPGLVPAPPGGFTRRAFDNGRLDLAEVEALGDLLSAETNRQRRQALSQLDGALTRDAARWQADLTRAAALTEALLDFEDEGEVATGAAAMAAEVATVVTAVAADIAEWLARPPAERLRDGLRVVVAGPPNAGKSTLVNALAGEEVAITAPVPGTTRDIIDVPLALGGIPLRLMDTAGLHAGTGDAVEVIGMARARRALARADMLLWLGDPVDAPAHPARLLVAARADERDPPPGSDVAVSVHQGTGVDAVRRWLSVTATMLVPPEGAAVANARQRAVLETLRASLAEAGGMVARQNTDWLLVAESLRAARAALTELVGGGSVDAMLDQLFGRFCVGK